MPKVLSVACRYIYVQLTRYYKILARTLPYPAGRLIKKGFPTSVAPATKMALGLRLEL